MDVQFGFPHKKITYGFYFYFLKWQMEKQYFRQSFSYRVCKFFILFFWIFCLFGDIWLTMHEGI